MGKKRVLIGGPPYMAQFTALMMILLACFILMVAMSPRKKEQGLKKGIGSIRNAFSNVGGFGIFDFISPLFGTKNAKNRKRKGNQDGVDLNTTLREGGAGNSSANTKDVDKGVYLRYQFHCTFNNFDSSLTKKTKENLVKLGTGLSVFNQKLVIECIASDYNDDKKNRQLATYRAANIMRFLAEQSGVSYVNMTALGEYNKSKIKPKNNTTIYFCVYNIEKTTKDTNNGR